jgi:hypothetical protein
VRETLRSNIQSSSRESENATSLVQQIELLHDEIATLRRENFASRNVIHDVNQLSRDVSDEYVVSPVLLDLRSSTLDVLTLAVGTSDGIRDRMLVTSPEGVAVGFIERAHSRYSQARLFSSADVTTNAILYGSTTLPVVLEGRGAGTMTLRIPKDIPLTTGMTVRLPTIHASALGEVVEVESTPEDAFQTAFVRSPIQQYELRYTHIEPMTVWEVPAQTEDTGASSTAQQSKAK